MIHMPGKDQLLNKLEKAREYLKILLSKVEALKTDINDLRRTSVEAVSLLINDLEGLKSSVEKLAKKFSEIEKKRE
ncbi:MAG: hypothetical protein ACP6IQ_08710 [Candidatus Njordarchaeia archaeon]